MRSLNLRNCGVLLALALAGYLPCALAQAEDGNTPDPSTKLGQVEQNLKISKDRQTVLTADIEAAVKAQAEISDKLIALAKNLESQQNAVQKADTKVQKLAAESVIIRSNLAEKEDQLSELLAGLQRLEQNPPPALVVEPKNILQALRGAMMFGAVVPEMRDQALDLQTKLQRLVAISTETQEARKSQEEALTALHASQDELVKLQADQKALALASAQDLETEKLRAADLATQAKSLKQLLVALEEEKKRVEAVKTAEAKAQEQAEKLKREALAKPGMVFTLSKGKLEYPVQGTILKQFGADNGLGRTLDGLAVSTMAEANVISPVDGRVEFAGPFRSYGQL